MFRVGETFVCEVSQKKEAFLLKKKEEEKFFPTTGSRYAFISCFN
jgi:hypothetical protein